MLTRQEFKQFEAAILGMKRVEDDEPGTYIITYGSLVGLLKTFYDEDMTPKIEKLEVTNEALEERQNKIYSLLKRIHGLKELQLELENKHEDALLMETEQLAMAKEALKKNSEYCDLCDDTSYVMNASTHDDIDCPNCRGLAIKTLKKLGGTGD